MQLHIGVFDRKTGTDSIRSRLFYLIMTGSIIWGLFAASLLAHKAALWDHELSLGKIFLYFFALPVTGGWMAIECRKPFLSFIGYNAIVLPIGFGLGAIFSHTDFVSGFFALTGIAIFITGTMCAIAPKIATAWWRPLAIATLCLIGTTAIRNEFSMEEALASAVFSGYIAVNLYRASQIVKSIDNAIDTSVDLYLNIVNEMCLVFGFEDK